MTLWILVFYKWHYTFFHNRKLAHLVGCVIRLSQIINNEKKSRNNWFLLPKPEQNFEWQRLAKSTFYFSVFWIFCLEISRAVSMFLWSSIWVNKGSGMTLKWSHFWDLKFRFFESLAKKKKNVQFSVLESVVLTIWTPTKFYQKFNYVLN